MKICGTPLRGTVPEGMTTYGWALYAHPLFVGQLENLTSADEGARAKLLVTLRKLMFDVIQIDPVDPEF